jgi:hypothetical protein
MPSREDMYRSIEGDPYCQTCFGYGYIDKELGPGDDVPVPCPQCVAPQLKLIESLPKAPSLAERFARLVGR